MAGHAMALDERLCDDLLGSHHQSLYLKLSLRHICLRSLLIYNVFSISLNYIE